MHNLPWNNIIYEREIDAKIKLFDSFVLTLFNVHAPIKEARITKPKAPWLTENIKIFMKQRDTALQKFKRTRDADDWILYKNLRNFTLSAVRREKRRYLNSLCDINNPKKTWTALKNFNVCSKYQV